jgi:hypothetical protein
MTRCTGGDEPKEIEDMATLRDTNVPEDGPPRADWSAVSYVGDGTAFFRAFRYTHRTHTLQDILRPGYWNPVPSGKKDECVDVQPWDEIKFCVCGEGKDPKDPFDASRGWLVIGKRPEKPGDDWIVGLVERHTTTPATNDDKQDKVKERKAA